MSDNFKEKALLFNLHSKGYEVEDLILFKIQTNLTPFYCYKLKYKEKFVYLRSHIKTDETDSLLSICNDIEDFPKIILESEKFMPSSLEFIARMLINKIYFETRVRYTFVQDELSDLTNKVYDSYDSIESFLENLDYIDTDKLLKNAMVLSY